MKTKLTPPLKWHGGKNYLAGSIINLMPQRCAKPNKPDPADPGWLHYVEPFAGGLAVLLENDPEGISEVANDLNGELTNFWRVLQGATAFNQFSRLVTAIPFSEVEYDEATTNSVLDADGYGETVHRAATFFVRCRQSLAGRMKGFAPLSRTRTRRGMNEQASAWMTAVEGLPAVHARLRRVAILNRDALDVIREQDGPRTLFYIDAPYLHETRATTGEYEHEMTEEQHRNLLSLLADIKGRFLLSGYRSALYDAKAVCNGWVRRDFSIANHAAGGESKRRMVECVWTNFDPQPHGAR